MQVVPVGVDIAKNVFQIHYVDSDTGEIVNKPLKRAKFLETGREINRANSPTSGGTNSRCNAPIAAGCRPAAPSTSSSSSMRRRSMRDAASQEQPTQPTQPTEGEFAGDVNGVPTWDRGARTGARDEEGLQRVHCDDSTNRSVDSTGRRPPAPNMPR